ncbi:nitroreductase family deazaflavin-dependent oxidoreductase [Actinomadura xylanilytica]|uniref:nitroreductase family deazaflavin-dependent oxidoreductase n=1 Tax=Actinomadura xylanilytica TaxID=887459 RepID=UPI00255A92CC|nr:nitroreductase family deazaflavin-dependent oxidoreductase [Actinomadura xylanilytica]MDL4775595.1 nitroreductase family deazaflavin-dependent oxidoreductase [Actinomadura xylanilytica]
MSRTPLPKSLARFNRVVTNRIQGVWAPFAPPLAVIVHRGRRTGREYRTPVLAFRDGRRLYVALPYGSDTDWVRNLLAEERGGVERLGRAGRLTEPRVVTEGTDASGAGLPGLARRIVRHMDVLVADIEEVPRGTARMPGRANTG